MNVNINLLQKKPCKRPADERTVANIVFVGFEEAAAYRKDTVFIRFIKSEG
jgi:hypothetical protein